MISPAILAAVCGTLICGMVAAADDVVEKKLSASNEEYKKAVKKAQAELLADLKKKEEAAQKAGDLNSLEKIQAEAKAFEQRGELPTSVPVRNYESQMRTARASLSDAFVDAVKQYTKDGKIALAKATQSNLDAFKAESSRPAASKERRLKEIVLHPLYGGVERHPVVYKGQEVLIKRLDGSLTPLTITPGRLKWQIIKGGSIEIDVRARKMIPRGEKVDIHYEE